MQEIATLRSPRRALREKKNEIAIRQSFGKIRQKIRHLVVPFLLIDDSRKGIKHQMNPSSLASCYTISYLCARPFAFSLMVTPHVLPIFRSNLNHLSEYVFALFGWSNS